VRTSGSRARPQQLEDRNATILETAQVIKEISEHPILREALREYERE
jgi:hypothetical protein